MTILFSFAALVAGLIIGYGFGMFQKKALERNRQKEESGKLKSAWAIMPGSAVRVAYLMLTLLAIQIACPMFFDNNIQWLVSAGVVLGYGWTFFVHLRDRNSAAHLY